jgi:signal transduction histidine kinase
MLLLEMRPAALTEAPLDNLLQHLVDVFKGRAPRCVIDLATEKIPIVPAVQIGLYRIAQEALNNIIKHSGASRASITLRAQADQIEMAIADNGRGFEPTSLAGEHMGLRIMRERAEAIGARLSIDSEVGRGTIIQVVWIDTAPAQIS